MAKEIPLEEIKWIPQMSVGEETIDKQHQEIISQINKELDTFEDEILTIDQTTEMESKELKISENLHKDIAKKFASQFKQRDSLRQNIQKAELQLIRFEERIKAEEERVNLLVIDKARVVSEIQGQKKEFEHMLTAFKYGVPPHAGIAPGIDRLLMVILGVLKLAKPSCGHCGTSQVSAKKKGKK